jgi:hypothetical protein
MSQSIEQQVSEKDFQLIEANQLGAPLALYRLKPVYVHIMHRCGLILLALGIIFLIFLLTMGVTGSPEGGDRYYRWFAMNVLVIGISFLFALFALYVEVPRAKKEHIIVCEQGMLQVGNKLLSKHIDVVRWLDVLAIEKSFAIYFSLYSIKRREGESVSLSMYQNVEELVEEIKQRSGIA